MNNNKIIEKLGLKTVTKFKLKYKNVTGGYTSDLLSDVIANSKKDNLWITLQTHVNIIAVASLKELAGIIIVKDKEPDEDTLQKAEQENIPIFSTDMNAFLISGRLYELGIR